MSQLNTIVTAARLRNWAVSTDDYQRFLDESPNGQCEVAQLYARLQQEKQQDAAALLLTMVFSEIQNADQWVALIAQITQATQGSQAHATTNSDREHATTAADFNYAAATGTQAHAATVGEQAHAATTGKQAHAATTGSRAHAATAGQRANASAAGDSSSASTSGADAVASAFGLCSLAKAGVGGAIALAHRDEQGTLLGVKAAMVGEHGIEPDVWYTLDANGNFQRVEDFTG